jgi:O-antigen ligase
MDQNLGILGLLLALPLLVLYLLPFWKLWRRTGHSVPVSLVMSYLSFIGLFVLAFKSWPAERQKG